jgi:hypothetical protein
MELEIPKDRIFLAGDAVSTDISCALQAGVVPIWISQFSLDELSSGKNGPGVVKTENRFTFVDLLKSLLL